MDSAVEFQPRSNRPSQKRNRVSHVCTNCRRRRQFVSISSSTGAWIGDSHEPSVIDARPALHVFVASRKVLAAMSLQQTSTCRAVVFTKSTLTAHRNASRTSILLPRRSKMQLALRHRRWKALGTLLSTTSIQLVSSVG